MTICTDTPEKIRAGHTKHGLKATMLSDRELDVTNLYGLKNQTIHTGPPGLSGLPVPTTILANAMGRVCWIDQSENYQQRSDPASVLTALRRYLDGSDAQTD